MTADRREQLWQVIAGVRDAFPRIPADADTDAIVNAVLPLVDAMCAESAADTLRDAATDWRRLSDGAGPVVRFLRARAMQIHTRAVNTTEGGQ